VARTGEHTFDTMRVDHEKWPGACGNRPRPWPHLDRR
jgi:hypothetical protein